MIKRLCVNFLLYLASRPHSDNTLVWTPQNKTIGKSKTWELGKPVVISKQIRQAAKSVARGEKITVEVERCIVRGHFKNQAHGTGRAERKRIYIRPYWRGELTTTENSPRDYVVK